jgi:hypothetical protein
VRMNAPRSGCPINLTLKALGDSVASTAHHLGISALETAGRRGEPVVFRDSADVFQACPYISSPRDRSRGAADGAVRADRLARARP